MQPLEYDAMNPSNRMKIALQSPVNRSNRVQHIAASTESFNQINMDILEQIVETKKKHVADCQAIYPVAFLEKSIYFPTKPVSLSRYILRDDKVGIIAEIKRKSPSKGIFKSEPDLERLSVGYMQAGASALSVLTDQPYFGGSNSDLTAARRFNYCPILRKDFIISEYQILESKSIGADAILLIAKILTREEIIRFTDLAHTLGMEVLLEFYDEQELDRYYPEVDVIGINNRNLNDFEVSFQRAIEMSKLLPPSALKVAESGIKSPEDVMLLRENGFDGFLIGETFMREAAPEEACRIFINRIEKLRNIKA